MVVCFLDQYSLVCKIIQNGKGWPVHLLAVACLSLAAKMEEPDVPNLVDLQIGESRFIFEPRTIQRMELLVMAKLKWRLWPVTPFSFIAHFVKKLDSPSALSSDRLRSKAVQLILTANRGKVPRRTADGGYP